MSRHFYIKHPKTASPVRPHARRHLQLEHAIRCKRVLHSVTGELIAYIIRHPVDGWYVFDENDNLIFAHKFDSYYSAFLWLQCLRGGRQPSAAQRVRAYEALKGVTDETTSRMR